MTEEKKDKPIQNGKGSAWRTLPNQKYARNYNSIFRKRLKKIDKKELFD